MQEMTKEMTSFLIKCYLQNPIDKPGFEVATSDIRKEFHKSAQASICINSY